MPPDISSFNMRKLRFGKSGEENLLLSDSTLDPHKKEPDLSTSEGKPTKTQSSETMRDNTFQGNNFCHLEPVWDLTSLGPHFFTSPGWFW